MRNTIIDAIFHQALTDSKVFLISGDAGFGVLDDYQQRLPDQYLNLGIAEQNMIGFSAGLSMSGFNVFVYNIVPFVLYRCYEQVRNDICYQRLPVTLIGAGAGLTYAPGGMTHYAIEDIGLAKTLPNLVVMSPADIQEAIQSIDFAIQHDSPVYIRVAKGGEAKIYSRDIKDIRKPVLVQKGKKTAVLFHGSVGEEVIKAVEMCSYEPTLISVPMLQPLDFEALNGMLDGVEVLITVEEHYTETGLGGILSHWIASQRLPYRLTCLGIKNEFVHAVKHLDGMRDHYGISAGRIRATIERKRRGKGE